MGYTPKSDSAVGYEKAALDADGIQDGKGTPRSE